MYLRVLLAGEADAPKLFATKPCWASVRERVSNLHFVHVLQGQFACVARCSFTFQQDIAFQGRDGAELS